MKICEIYELKRLAGNSTNKDGKRVSETDGSNISITGTNRGNPTRTWDKAIQELMNDERLWFAKPFNRRKTTKD